MPRAPIDWPGLRAKIVRASRLMHGKTDMIHHDGRDLFDGIPNPVRGHTLP